MDISVFARRACAFVRLAALLPGFRTLFAYCAVVIFAAFALRLNAPGRLIAFFIHFSEAIFFLLSDGGGEVNDVPAAGNIQKACLPADGLPLPADSLRLPGDVIRRLHSVLQKRLR